MRCSVSKQMRRANKSNQAYPGRPWLLAIAGSTVLLLSSVLSNPIMQSAYSQTQTTTEEEYSYRIY